ncbi:alcohol dehydrogenase catalytic domain-containing protein [Microbacterium fluvii]|uniref:Alcohol dehydrogenase catalytic domain-containing protein n=1 Tax=Microbacterium fluvii TaxID=415215 RepID=A0ABW2HDA1_9MICO|nr:alcohol dehydrogenase catalytic domain-containing protein [Microbacterium fluvii]MCU4672955.1 alcohol dehydrogenase catalytic domain-containing protein [Microbacterium fluvii]
MTDAVAALVRERGGSAALTAVRLREPGEGEILVRIAASGVCPTDLFAIDGGAGDVFPAVFGHEGAGVVEAIGTGVDRIRPGDHVVLGFDSCGFCDACRGGHPASCARFAALNYRGRLDDLAVDATGEPVRTAWMAQSSWATRVIVRERSAAVIAPDVPWEVAATLGCGILTGAGTVFNVLAPGPGDVLLVIGAGTTGLAAVMAAAHRGVGEIVVCESVAERRALALEVGATRAVAPADLGAAWGSVRPTHALDTVGTQGTVDAALESLAQGGVCATIALKPGENPVLVSQSRLLWGRGLRGVIEGDADVPRDIARLVALWHAGRLPVERLIRRYSFDDLDAAIADARSGEVVKAVVMVEPAAAGAGAYSASAARTSDAAAALGADAARVPAGDALGEAPAELTALLRSGAVPADDLPALWRSLPPVSPAELRGFWRGTGLTASHPAHRLLVRHRWIGKLFRGDDDVAPIVGLDENDAPFADVETARGGASLRTVVHDGITTAAMLYDGQPIVDCFTRIGPDAVLGVMTGRGTAAPGSYFFVLERSGDLAL